MDPLRIAPGQPAVGRFGLGGIAFEPIFHDEVIKLLRPEQARERLALDPFAVFGKIGTREGIKLVRFRDPFREDAVEILNLL